MLSPTMMRRVLGRIAFSSESISSVSTIDISSIISTSQVSGLSSRRLNAWDLELKSTSSRRWIVCAGAPVRSAMRFAARPVGAASFIFSPRFLHSEITALSVVVLPVPGPPVSMNT